jgi:DNA-binding NtrC family response regulator
MGGSNAAASSIEHGGAWDDCGLVGSSAPMRRLRMEIDRVILSDRPVLVCGPTGSGKEGVVRAIHELGARSAGLLVDVNCGALPSSLIESQLFGHKRGAFTGADREHEGFFTAVGEGALFLDEIAELPIDLQAKLLRVLETGLFRPIGAIAAERFRGRVIAATHADLEERVQLRTFREDLYYRLAVLEVRVPSLEERRDDIPALTARFADAQTRPMTFTDDALRALQAARWPGNVRQLRNVVDRLAVFAPDGPITAEDVARVATDRVRRQTPPPVEDLARAVLELADGDKLAAAESALVAEAMRRASGNKAAAARLLGVHRKVIERRLDRASG